MNLTRLTFLAIVLTTVLAAHASRGETTSISEVTTYANNPKAQEFIEQMVKKHKFERASLVELLSQAEKKQSILDAISRPAEKTKEWFEYRDIFLGQNRIDQGIEFWAENEAVLTKASTEYGVPAEIIVAIIGVETLYGRHKGNYRVIDALATLGFDYPPRSEFFSRQLEEFFLLVREQKQDPLSLKGSYAGAMGFGQFIPSSYRTFARDNDGDGLVDIWNNKSDAIGSVANYFKAHGWQMGEPVFAKATVAAGVNEELFNTRQRPEQAAKSFLKEGIILNSASSAYNDKLAVPLSYKNQDGVEYLFGFNNFYVITRYNRSQLYARAVWDLSQAIVAQRAEKAKKLP